MLGSIEGTNGNDFHDVEKLQLLVSTEKVVTDNPVRNGQITQDEIGQRILTALKQVLQFLINVFSAIFSFIVLSEIFFGWWHF